MYSHYGDDSGLSKNILEAKKTHRRKKSSVLILFESVIYCTQWRHGGDKHTLGVHTYEGLYTRPLLHVESFMVSLSVSINRWTLVR